MDMEVPLSTLSAPLRMKFHKSEWLLESNVSKPQHFRFYKKIGKMQPAQPELRPKVLDLFAGAGGMSLGFNNNGMEVKWAVEKGQRCC